jgi:hypothetical protein
MILCQYLKPFVNTVEGERANWTGAGGDEG